VGSHLKLVHGQGIEQLVGHNQHRVVVTLKVTKPPAQEREQD
jgi:hypothetical protein